MAAINISNWQIKADSTNGSSWNNCVEQDLDVLESKVDITMARMGPSFMVDSPQAYHMIAEGHNHCKIKSI